MKKITILYSKRWGIKIHLALSKYEYRKINSGPIGLSAARAAAKRPEQVVQSTLATDRVSEIKRRA